MCSSPLAKASPYNRRDPINSYGFPSEIIGETLENQREYTSDYGDHSTRETDLKNIDETDVFEEKIPRPNPESGWIGYFPPTFGLE